jgi:signal transduction histidine kinase
MTSVHVDRFAFGHETSTAMTRPRRRAGLPSAIGAVLRVPLVLKLIGANILIALATVAAALATHGTTLADRRVVALVIVALVAAQIVNSALVIVALRPLRSLEDVAARVLSGDTRARVADSPLADRNVARTGQALNTLLDELMKERDQIRRLAVQVIRAQDEERARIARELHDATAQTMAGVVLQLSAARQSCSDVDMRTRLEEIGTVASEALEDVRTLSHTIYPRILEDLGLRAALDWLARRTRESSGLDIEVIVRGSGSFPAIAASALYRVAQEALLNAVRHSSATAIELRLDTDLRQATLEVEDNGTGFNVQEAEARRPGMGIFSMRERIALVDGVFDIDSSLGEGCCVRATVPLNSMRP